MAAHDLAAAPVLSTPDTHIFEDPTPPTALPPASARLSAEQLALTYEIERTVAEIRNARWKRIALQFPDAMLVDAPRVYDALARGLASARRGSAAAGQNDAGNGGADEAKDGGSSGGGGTAVPVEEQMAELDVTAEAAGRQEAEGEEELFILGDTSYGACCVDEVAAEHVDADAVVHYGRACLSPTARLPVVYVFTRRPLDVDVAAAAFRRTHADKGAKVVLAADIPYAHHVPAVRDRLREDGYAGVFAAEVVHDPSSQIPNRTVPEEVKDRPEALKDYALFHIAEPPASLLLILASRVAAVHIYPADGEHEGGGYTKEREALQASTSMALRRRYALLTSLSTAPIFGVLVNTLSVKNYLHVVEHIKGRIAAAGKKSYTFVVGKVNAAKVANFSEVAGWVVIGCWESSLIESKEFWRPIITPFELELALQGDTERVWTGTWTSDFQAVLESAKDNGSRPSGSVSNSDRMMDQADGEADSGEESMPPEFDLRTGRYVSRTRPMQAGATGAPSNPGRDEAAGEGEASGATTSKALARRANGDVAQVGGVASPGAEFLRSKRTWKGLGSDFEIAYEEDGGVQGAAMEEGRRGLARGYVVGGDGESSRR